MADQPTDIDASVRTQGFPMRCVWADGEHEDAEGVCHRPLYDPEGQLRGYAVTLDRAPALDVFAFPDEILLVPEEPS